MTLAHMNDLSSLEERMGQEVPKIYDNEEYLTPAQAATKYNEVTEEFAKTIASGEIVAAVLSDGRVLVCTEVENYLDYLHVEE